MNISWKHTFAKNKQKVEKVDIYIINYIWEFVLNKNIHWNILNFYKKKNLEKIKKNKNIF